MSVRVLIAPRGAETASPRTQRTGAVLLIVVVLVMLMSLAAYRFLLAMQTENLAAGASGDRLVARQAAYSARDTLMVLLELPRQQRDLQGGLHDNPLVFGGQSLVEQQPQVDLGVTQPLARSLMIRRSHSATAGLNADPALSTADSPPIQFGAVNESSKLHLRNVLQWEQESPGAGMFALMNLPAMDEATAAAILDWLDEDTEPRPLGAEVEFYRSLTNRLAPRNGMIPDMDELLLVRGVDSARMFGITNQLSVDEAMTGANEASLSRAPSPRPMRQFTSEEPDSILPWLDYLTIYSAERDESYAGLPRIPVNDEQLSDLHQRLVSVMPLEWANFIVLYRQFGPSNDEPGSEGNQAETRGAAQQTIDFSRSAAYRIESPLDLCGVSIRLGGANEEEEPVVVESPFSSEPSIAQTQIPELLDKITIHSGDRITGRVNINEAPAEVLAGLPGMDPALLEQVLGARTAGPASVEQRQHPAWLFTEGIIGLEAMRQLLPRLTTGGDVYRGQCWGYIDPQAPMVAFETVIDASQGPARQVYFREIPAEHPQFPAAWLESPANTVAAGESSTASNGSRQQDQP